MKTAPAISWPLGWKFLVLLLLVFLPFLVVVVVKGIRQRDDEIAKAQNNAFLLAQSLAAQQEQLVTTTETVLTMLAQSHEVQTLDRNACNQVFADVKRRYPFFETIFATTPDGEVFAASGPFPSGTNLADRKHIKEAIQTRKFAVGEYIVGRISSAVVLSYAYPVLDSNQRLIAVVGAGFAVSNYNDFVSELRLPPGYNVVITDWKGTRLFRWPESPLAPIGQPLMQQGFKLISGSDEQGFREWTSPDGVTRIHAFRQMRIRKGAEPYSYIAVGVPKTLIFHQAEMGVIHNLLLLFVGACAILLVAWKFGDILIVKPINRLVESTRRFGSGDLDVRTGLPYTGDEVGVLAKSFDEMAALLEKKNAERESAREALNKANAELEQRVEERTKKLAEFSQRLKLHRDLSPLAVIEWNLSFEAVDWNLSAERMFGYRAEEATGRHALDLIVPSSARDHVQQVWKDMLSGKGPSRSANENITKSGKTIICEWHNTPLVDASGQMIGVASVVQDVSEARQLQQQLLQSQKMDAIGRLAGGVAHDFNNLLMVISSYTELLLKTLEDDRQRRYGEQVLKASRRAAELTGQLLAFSRKQVFAPRSLNLNEIVTDMGKMLPRMLGEDIDLQLRLAGDLRQCKADPTQLEQVILNLAVNARDAMPKGGRLVLETANAKLDAGEINAQVSVAAGEYVMLSVTDNGGGMSPEIQEHIFEPFFTTKDVGKGTGLGLSTVYGIIEQSGGYVLVESAPGRGSTFKIYLPRIEEPATILSTSVSASVAVPNRAATILLVEDEPALRRAGTEYLETLGYSVVVAADGEQALQRAREYSGPIDVLVTDVVMPGINGAELAERLRVFRPEIRILYMSGYSESHLRHDPAIKQDDTFLQKPFSFRLLGDKLETMLAKRTTSE